MKIYSIQNTPSVNSNKYTSNPFDVSFLARQKEDKFEKEIDIYINPITKAEDENFSVQINLLSEIGFRNAYDIVASALDSKGVVSDSLYRLMNLFCKTPPHNFSTRVDSIREKIARFRKIGQFDISFDAMDCNMQLFLEVIKNNNGEFSKKNEKFLYKLIRAAAKEYKEDGLCTSEVADLLTACKNEQGEIDDKKAKVAINILKKVKKYDKTEEYIKAYFEIPEQNRKYVVDCLNSVEGDEVNKILNFPAASKFCFEDGKLNIENLEFYQSLIKANDTEFGNWTFGLAKTNSNTRGFILQYVGSCENIPWESYWFGDYILSVNIDSDIEGDLILYAQDYYKTKGTFEGLKELFYACLSSLADDETEENIEDDFSDESIVSVKFDKSLFEFALQLVKEELDSNFNTRQVLSGDIPVQILSGNFRPETLPYSKRVEIKEALLRIKDTSFAQEIIEDVLVELDNSLSPKDIMIPIDNKIKHNFIAEILKSDNAKCSDFERVLIDSIPLLENLEGGIQLKYSKEELLLDLYLQAPNEDKFNELIKKLGITITSVFDDTEEHPNAPASYDGFIDINSFVPQDDYEIYAHDLISIYLFENFAMTESEELNKYLNLIIKALPEFINIIGKQQHQTQKYSLDIHCLLAMAYSIQNPQYQNLSQANKAILKFSALLHDIAKKEHIIDTGHQYLSSEIVKKISSKIFQHPRAQERICEFVANHHWLAEYSKGVKGFSAPEVAIRFRRQNDFEMAKIMAHSDLKAVSPEFYERLKTALLPEKLERIDRNLEILKLTSNILPTDRFVNKRKLDKHIQYRDGVAYKVVDLKSLPDDADMSEFGFSHGKKKNDLRFCVHMLDSENLSLELATLKTLENPANNGILSESIIAPNATRTYKYREHGVILSHLSSNILTANNENIYSGYEKDLPSFVSNLTEDTKIMAYRSKFINDFLAGVGYRGTIEGVEKEYLEFCDNVLSKIYSLDCIKPDEMYQIGDVKFSGLKLKEVLCEIMDNLIDFSGNTHNEVIAYLPSIEAVVSKANCLDDVPIELLEFANKNNLPVVLI